MTLCLDRRVTLLTFSLAAVGAGAARGLTTTYLPVLVSHIQNSPTLIGVIMTINAVAGLVVPLAVGAWSDRRAAGGLGRRLPFMVGGSVVAVGGLLAVALDAGSSYLALALAAAVVYTGLNAITTMHRALVADDVEAGRHTAATSAQEIAAVVGGATAVAIGAVLIDVAPAVAFVLAAALLVVTAAPTLMLVRRLGLGDGAPRGQAEGGCASIRAAFGVRGPREVLLAQALWSFAYAALPSFFVLYAHDELGVGVGIAGALSLAVGLTIPLGMLLAGRIGAGRIHRALVAGAAMVATGLGIAGLTGAIVPALIALAAAGLGAGLLAALGFPYFARFIPDGEAGSYSGAFFAARGVAGAVATPLAGLAVELTGTYRSVPLLGVAALGAIPALLAAERRRKAGLATASAATTLSTRVPIPDGAPA
jgi:DHA1 family tetracycline resistance protein-like MFS transporter